MIGTSQSVVLREVQNTFIKEITHETYRESLGLRHRNNTNNSIVVNNSNSMNHAEKSRLSSYISSELNRKELEEVDKIISKHELCNVL